MESGGAYGMPLLFRRMRKTERQSKGLFGVFVRSTAAAGSFWGLSGAP